MLRSIHLLTREGNFDYKDIQRFFCCFDVRSWCTVSQTYNLRELLIDIFGQVTGVKHHVHASDGIVDMLCKCLLGKRYLSHCVG